jgi:SAM-dependent methyltransferase
MPSTPRGDADPASVPQLVCPFDLGELTSDAGSQLRCRGGHSFAVKDGTPSLAVTEGWAAHLHHRPDRRLSGSRSYDDAHLGLDAGPVGPARTAVRNQAARVREVGELYRVARWWCHSVDQAWETLAVEAPDPPPLVTSKRFEVEYGTGLYFHEVLKRLEKERFWDRVELGRPSLEVGVSHGAASRYFFSGRTIDFGSEFLLADLLGSAAPHLRCFSANIKFLPFADGTLETVLCSQTVTCLYVSIISVLAEVNRVLRPGGRFVFTTHGPGYLQGLPLHGWPAMALSAADCRRANEQRAGYMAHLYALQEWRQILGATGFELAESVGIFSADLARYSHLFYDAENGGPNPFRDPYRTSPLMRFYLGGIGGYRRCEKRYRDLASRVLAHELSRPLNSEFDERQYLDAGIVAVKRSTPPLRRIEPAR